MQAMAVILALIFPWAAGICAGESRCTRQQAVAQTSCPLSQGSCPKKAKKSPCCPGYLCGDDQGTSLKPDSVLHPTLDAKPLWAVSLPPLETGNEVVVRIGVPVTLARGHPPPAASPYRNHSPPQLS